MSFKPCSNIVWLIIETDGLFMQSRHAKQGRPIRVTATRKKSKLVVNQVGQELAPRRSASWSPSSTPPSTSRNMPQSTVPAEANESETFVVLDLVHVEDLKMDKDQELGSFSQSLLLPTSWLQQQKAKKRPEKLCARQATGNIRKGKWHAWTLVSQPGS